jgi:uncharacterized membrane protein
MDDLERGNQVTGNSFSLVLHPHRSLSPKGFLILMLFIGGVSFVTGMAFLMMGAWPVLGFFGLDVALIYIAFRFNFKSGRRFEVIEIDDGELSIRVVKPDAADKTNGFQAYWSRIVLDKGRLFIRCRQESMEIGGFLIEEEKAEVKELITAALYKYRNNALR